MHYDCDLHGRRRGIRRVRNYGKQRYLPHFWYRCDAARELRVVFGARRQTLNVIRDELLERWDRRMLQLGLLRVGDPLQDPSPAPKPVLFDAMNE